MPKEPLPETPRKGRIKEFFEKSEAKENLLLLVTAIIAGWVVYRYWSIGLAIQHLIVAGPSPQADAIVFRLEHQGAKAIYVRTLKVYLFALPIHCILTLLLYSKVFRKAEESLRWLYSIVAYFGVLLALQFASVPILRHLFPDFEGRHVTYLQASTRVMALIALLLAAATIHISKQKTLVIFGLAEIIVAMISNAAIVGNIDFSNFPHLQTSSTSWFGLLVFTLVLRTGIGDTIDGINKLREKHGGHLRSWWHQ